MLKNTYPLCDRKNLSRSTGDISPKSCQQKQNKIQISLHLQESSTNPTFAIQFTVQHGLPLLQTLLFPWHRTQTVDLFGIFIAKSLKITMATHPVHPSFYPNIFPLQCTCFLLPTFYQTFRITLHTNFLMF